MPILPLQLGLVHEGVSSNCWCPLEPGACSAPFDMQAASLVRELEPLTAKQEATLLLGEAVLEHIRAGRLYLATRQANYLAALFGLS